MDAWIALGLSIVSFAADPMVSLNQPRPRMAKPVPTGVVPVKHEKWEDESESTALVPPAPLPEFVEVEFPQIHFRTIQPESCTDSKACLPAPPAEADASMLSPGILLLDDKPFIFRTHSLTLDPVVSCDEAPAAAGFDLLSGEAPAVGNFLFRIERPLPAQLFQSEIPTPVTPSGSVLDTESVPLVPDVTTEAECPAALQSHPIPIREQLSHLQAAMEHLAAIGMTDVVDELRPRYRMAQTHFEERLRELAAKEAELARLSRDVQQLRADLKPGDDQLSAQDSAASSTPSSTGRFSMETILQPQRNGLPSVLTPLAIPIPAWPHSAPTMRQAFPQRADTWRHTPSQPILPLSGVPDAEYAAPVPIPPARAPIHLIPSPDSSGRPQLLFPLAPMRSVEPPAAEPDAELPPAPIPDDALSQSDKGPVI